MSKTLDSLSVTALIQLVKNVFPGSAVLEVKEPRPRRKKNQKDKNQQDLL